MLAWPWSGLAAKPPGSLNLTWFAATAVPSVPVAFLRVRGASLMIVTRAKRFLSAWPSFFPIADG